MIYLYHRCMTYIDICVCINAISAGIHEKSVTVTTHKRQVGIRWMGDGGVERLFILQLFILFGFYSCGYGTYLKTKEIIDMDSGKETI